MKDKEIIETTEKAVRKDEDNAGAFVNLLNQEQAELKKATIEEMRRLIKLPIENWLEDTGAIPQATTYYAELIGCINDSAEVLFNEDYRKLPKDSVVLTKEELEEKYEPSETFMAVSRELEELKESLKDSVVLPKKLYELYMNELHNYEVGKRNGSKETAEKFYDKICTNTCVFTTPPTVSEDYNKGYVQAMADHSERIDQVAKQFGVEIKE